MTRGRHHMPDGTSDAEGEVRPKRKIRAASDYRSARRNLARKLKLDWRELPRAQHETTGMVRVFFPSEPGPPGYFRWHDGVLGAQSVAVKRA